MTDYERDGHVYVIEFSDGTIKVGRAGNWMRRLATHVGDAQKFGVSVIRTFCSIRHRDYASTERKLIAEARNTSTSQVRSEYFGGADFDSLADFIESLPLAPSSADQQASDAAEAEERMRPWREHLAAKTAENEAGTWVLVGGSSADFLSLLLDPRIDAGEPEKFLPPDDETSPLISEVIDSVSRAHNIPRGDVERMDSIDLMESIAILAIQTAAMRRKNQALTGSRDDLMVTLGTKEITYMFEASPN